MDKQKIERYIDELYALQKQSGERMVQLTEENKWILERQERNVTKNINSIRRYCKILGISILASCIIGTGVLWWVTSNYKNILDSGLYTIYKNVMEMKVVNKAIKIMLDDNKKSKNTSGVAESTEKEK